MSRKNQSSQTGRVANPRSMSRRSLPPKPPTIRLAKMPYIRQSHLLRIVEVVVTDPCAPHYFGPGGANTPILGRCSYWSSTHRNCCLIHTAQGDAACRLPGLAIHFEQITLAF
jgi:hypothetical protein